MTERPIAKIHNQSGAPVAGTTNRVAVPTGTSESVRTAVSIRNLTVAVGSAPHQTRSLLAVDSLDIPAGSTVLIEGESGSGKSTLLRILAGLVAPRYGGVSWSGTVAVGDTPLSTESIAAYRRGVFWLAQAPQLEPGTVEDTFRVIQGFRASGDGAASHSGRSGQSGRAATTIGPDRGTQSIDTVLESLGLSPSIRTQSVRSISGGEAARVAIARMILIQRPLLLLDEPTAALDTDRSEQIIPVVRANVPPETTIIVTGHDRELRGYVDTNLTLRDGTIR